MSTTTTTQSAESLDELDDDADDVFDELRALDRRSHGQWVNCVCTAVEDNSDTSYDHDIKYRFETVNGVESIKTFDVPRAVEGSDIQQFLDGVGYSIQNARELAGDTFWLHVENKEIRDEVPRFDVSLPSLKFQDPKSSSGDSLFLIPLVFWPLLALFSPLDILDSDMKDRVRGFASGVLTTTIWLAVIFILVWFLFA